MADKASLIHIDDITQAAQSWLEAHVKALKVHFPRTMDGDEIKKLESSRAVCAALFLSGITPDHPGRSGITQAESFTISYQGKLLGANTLKQHRVLSELYFAAHSDTAFQMKIAATPQAVFTLSTKLVRPAYTPTAPQVTGGVNVSMSGVGYALGRVTSQDGIPIPRAEISVPNGKRAFAARIY